LYYAYFGNSNKQHYSDFLHFKPQVQHFQGFSRFFATKFCHHIVYNGVLGVMVVTSELTIAAERRYLFRQGTDKHRRYFVVSNLAQSHSPVDKSLPK